MTLKGKTLVKGPLRSIYWLAGRGDEQATEGAE